MRPADSPAGNRPRPTHGGRPIRRPGRESWAEDRDATHHTPHTTAAPYTVSFLLSLLQKSEAGGFTGPVG